MFTRSARILVIDDVEMISRYLKSILDDLGYTKVDVAEDGEQAWNMIWEAAKQDEPYGLIFSDLMMPKMNGIELLKKVRATPQVSNIPFIVVSADIHSTRIREAIQSGCNQYIVKPFNRATLVEKLEVVARYKNQENDGTL